MVKKFLSRQELAEALGVSLSTVDRGIREQIWPYCQFIKIGRRIFYAYTLLQTIEAKANRAELSVTAEVVA